MTCGTGGGTAESLEQRFLPLCAPRGPGGKARSQKSELTWRKVSWSRPPLRVSQWRDLKCALGKVSEEAGNEGVWARIQIHL